MFAEKSVIFNFCEILFQIKDDLYKNRLKIFAKYTYICDDFILPPPPPPAAPLTFLYN